MRLNDPHRPRATGLRGLTSAEAFAAFAAAALLVLMMPGAWGENAARAESAAVMAEMRASMTGACCYDLGGPSICATHSPSDCQIIGGVYLGDDTLCSPDPCAHFGACCASDGTCTQAYQALCTGAYQGDGSTCTPNPCPGACCNLGTGNCLSTSAGGCGGVGFSFTAGGSCNPNNCTQPLGACCAADGSCTSTLKADCTADWITGACTPYPCACPVAFDPKTDFGAGTNPASVAIGDLNGDGKPDLAVANISGGNVSVLLGDGMGSFGAAANFGAGSGPSSVAIGDLNGDGKPDLATANYFSDNVSVLLGDGMGSFGAAANFGAGNTPTSVAIGDLNGDGKPDLATANYFSDNVSVLLGDGMGSFGAAANFGAVIGPQSVAVRDLNGDGKPDLAVANGSSNDVSVLLGNGMGSFGAAANFGAGSGPFSVAIGDLNGDGKPDLAVANGSSNDVSVLLGNGMGSFGAAANFGAGSGPFSVAIGDLNGDGKPDLAVANISGGNVSVLLGDGMGSFGAAANFGAGNTPTSVAIGDLNGDGKPDLAVANGEDNNVSVLLGQTCPQCPFTFHPAANFGADNGPFSVAVGDLNGDGKPDLAVANGNSDNLSVLLGNGNGTFQAQVLFGADNAPISVAIGDLNGDGKPDLAAANFISANVSVRLGTGNPIPALMFGPVNNFPAGLGPTSVAIGDLNGDGKPDLAVANSFVSSTVSVLLGTGNPIPAMMFDLPIPFGTGADPVSVAIGDVNGDGKLDLATANQNSANVSVLLGTGNPIPAMMFGPANNFPAGNLPFSVAIGDLNGDGKPDLAVVNQLGDDVSVLLGTGNPIPAMMFGLATNFGAGNAPISVAIGDLNGDGKPDLAVAASLSDDVSVLLGDGTGSFGAAASFATGNGAYSVAIADLNGDGKPDLAVANSIDGNVSVLLGDRICTGACCNDDAATCTVVPEAECVGAVLTYLGDNTVCDPDPCVPQDDCNQNGISDAIDISSGFSKDCNHNGIPDECECCWVQGPCAADPDGQSSHIGGSIQGGTRVADDFYVCPGQVLKVYGFTGHIVTNSIPSPVARKARLDFYEDCDGKPGLVPFATFLNPSILDTTPSASRPGFDIVHWFFDFCSNSLWLDGGKSYWVSLVGLTDGQGSDESYWAALPDTEPMIGAVPYKASGPSPGPVITFDNTTWGPWDPVTDCCIGCVNMDFSLRCEACLCIWDNGAPRTDVVGGEPSGVNLTKEARAVDNFVIPECEDRPLCLLEGWVWTTCLNPDFFLELYGNDCGMPGELLQFGEGGPGYSVSAMYTGVTKASGGKTYKLYKVSAQFFDPISLSGGTYWISVGATQAGAFNAKSLFAARADACPPACSIKIGPAQWKNIRPTLDPLWTITGHDLAFRVGLKPAEMNHNNLLAAGGGAARSAACAADLNNDGHASVQDLFDYLSAYFAGCP